MTTVAVVLIGAGVLLMASALDNTSLVDTFKKIINGDTINWSGTPPAQTTTAPNITGPNNIQNVPPVISGTRA